MIKKMSILRVLIMVTLLLMVVAMAMVDNVVAAGDVVFASRVTVVEPGKAIIATVIIIAIGMIVYIKRNRQK